MRVTPFVIGNDDSAGFFCESGDFTGGKNVVGKWFFANNYRYTGLCCKAAVPVMTVRVSGNHQNMWFVNADHFGGIFIYWNIPFFGIQFAPFFVCIAACG